MISTVRTVHIVDDDPSVRQALARLLKVAGYEVCTYGSAGEFLIAAGTGDVGGCLVLDVRMPGPSGLDLQEALAKTGTHLPIIFISGHADIPTSVRAVRAGAVDFLEKPVSRASFLRAVENALGQEVRRQAT